MVFKKAKNFSSWSNSFFLGVFFLSVTGCASTISPIVYKGDNLSIQQTAPDKIIVHSGSKAVTEKVEESSGKNSRVRVFAPTDNDHNIAVVRHGVNSAKYQAYAWPNNSPFPCVIQKNIGEENHNIEVEWATSTAFSVVDEINREVHEVVAYDGQIPGWTQISPNREILKICPSEETLPSEMPLIEGEYEAGRMQVIVGRDGHAVFVFYNNEFYRIDLETPVVMPLEGRVTVSPNGKIAIIAILDGEGTNQLRLYAWSAKIAKPTKKLVSLGIENEIDVRWITNRSVSVSSKTGVLKVIRYNLDRSWKELNPKQLP
jgi:hypothetical protein